MKSSTLLGAALAGLSASAHAATIYTDTDPGSDLGNSPSSPTDLSGVFSDFRNMGRVDGSFTGGAGPDFRDHFLVDADPGESYSIPFSYDGAGNQLFVQVYWGPAGSPQLIDSFPFAAGSGDSSIDSSRCDPHRFPR
ncbi:MAG: hypothetical protein ACPG32_15915 [Akkermansiaceae bacterium]